MKRASLPITYQDLIPGPSTAPRDTANSTSFTEAIPRVSYKPARDRLHNWRSMFRRLLKPRTLDFETATWEIVHLIVNPRKMYRTNYTYKQHDRTYARDDPLFLILLTAFLCMLAVAWGLAYLPTVGNVLKLMFTMVVFDFYICGLVVATLLWLGVNKLFNPQFTLALGAYSVNYVDWGFCFDVHCNAFLVIWCLLYLVQFFLLPVINIKKSLFSLLLGNSLYFGAVGYYFVITFYGFNSLPFIGSSVYRNSQNPARRLQLIILAGVLPLLALGWLLTILFRFNVAYAMVHKYFT